MVGTLVYYIKCNMTKSILEKDLLRLFPVATNKYTLFRSRRLLRICNQKATCTRWPCVGGFYPILPLSIASAHCTVRQAFCFALPQMTFEASIHLRLDLCLLSTRIQEVLRAVFISTLVFFRRICILGIRFNRSVRLSAGYCVKCETQQEPLPSSVKHDKQFDRQFSAWSWCTSTSSS